MSEMVERVARALARKDGADPDANAGWLLEENRRMWENYAEDARAAIEAMREPDPLMIAAMNNAAASYPGDNLELRMWRSGIDQALGDRDREAAALSPSREDEGKC